MTFVIHLFHESVLWKIKIKDKRVILQYLFYLFFPLLTILIIYLPNWSYFTTYINQALSSIWAADLSIYSRVTYYLPFLGPIDSTGIGFWGRNIASYIIVLIAFAFALISRQISRSDGITLFALIIISVACYIPIVISPQMQMPLGAVFAGSILALLLKCFKIAFKSPKIGNIASIAVIAASLFVFKLPVVNYQEGVLPNQASIIDEVSILNRFSESMIKLDKKDTSIYFNNGPIPYFNFGIYMYLKSGKFPQSMAQPYSFNTTTINRGIEDADFIIIFHVIDQTDPYYALGKQVEEYLLSNIELKEIDNFPLGESAYTLYSVNETSK